jgi:hypothetical protein
MRNKSLDFVLLFVSVLVFGILSFFILDSVNDNNEIKAKASSEKVNNFSRDFNSSLSTRVKAIYCVPDYESKYRVENLFDVDNIRIAIAFILVFSTAYIHRKNKYYNKNLVLFFSLYLGISISIILNSLIVLVFHHFWDFWFFIDYLFEGITFGFFSFVIVILASKLLSMLKIYYANKKFKYLLSNTRTVMKGELLPKIKPAIFLYTILYFEMMIKRVFDFLRDN